jgi:hypothetical protein
MAFALDGFVVTFALAGVMDADRVKEVEFIPVGADIAAQRAQLDTDISAWITAFNNNNARDNGVSNAFVTGYTVSEKYFEETNIPAFTMDDNIYLEAYVNAPREGGTGKIGTGIPAPAARIFANDSYNSGVIDKEDAVLETFMTLYSDGGGNCALSDGEQVQNPVNIQDARIRTVKTGKSL